MTASNKGVVFMNMLKISVAAAILAASASGAYAQSNIYLEVPGVKGDVKASGFIDQIEVLSSSFGLTNDKKSCVAQQLYFVKYVDMASADLIMATALGTLYPTMKLTFTRTSGGGVETPALQLMLSNATLSSFQSGASSGQNNLTEQLSIKYGTLTGKVYNQDPMGGVTPEPFNVNCF